MFCREGAETRFLVRTLVQNLRVGANWRSIIGALARAVQMHRCLGYTPRLLCNDNISIIIIIYMNLMNYNNIYEIMKISLLLMIRI